MKNFHAEDETLIEVKNLTKKYGVSYAVKNISFTIEPGHIYGFLGPNGAGKSTTMNIITGCLAATSGNVSINGHDIYEDPVNAKKCIGYLPEIPPLYTEMTPLEYLEFVAAAKGVSPDELEHKVDEVIEMTGLADMANRLIRNLSKGYRQRVGIAQALLGDPEIIILDEPTVGLDPLQIIEIRDLIKRLGEEHTVILSSHILSEIQAVCDKVIIISHGRIVADTTLEDLAAAHSKTNVINITSRGDSAKIKSALEKIKGVLSVKCKEVAGEVHAEVESTSEVDVRDGIFGVYCDCKATILSMVSDYLTLEDIFIKLTSEIPEEEEPFEEEKPVVKRASRKSPLGSAYYDDDDESDEECDDDESDDDDDYKPMFSNEEDDD